ncbi:MAG: hypothetical protein U0R64_08345 [Candidatus Nanopelagicales bacterium]
MAPTHDRHDWSTVAAVAVIVIVIASVQLFLPDSVTIGPVWLIPAIELLGIPAGLLAMQWFPVETKESRIVVGAYLVLLVAASVLNAALLFVGLLNGATESADALLFAGFGVLVINVLSFAMVYWWLDAGGPVARLATTNPQRDFLFPQQGFESSDWQPEITDYCFTAYTNIIAFSPTDTMPLTHRAKALFTIQSAVSLVTILVTLSRAINLID